MISPPAAAPERQLQHGQPELLPGRAQHQPAAPAQPGAPTAEPGRAAAAAATAAAATAAATAAGKQTF